MPDGIDLSQYVHISQFEQLQAELDVALQEIEAGNKEREAHTKTQGELEKAAKRLQDLEGKVRGRAHRDAAEKLFDELKVKKEHRDDLYELAKWKADADEPDASALKKHLGGVLENRKWALEADDKPAKKKLDAEGQPAGRGGSVNVQEGKFRVSRSQLRDRDWMKQNQARYAEAHRNGEVALVDD